MQNWLAASLITLLFSYMRDVRPTTTSSFLLSFQVSWFASKPKKNAWREACTGLVWSGLTKKGAFIGLFWLHTKKKKKQQ